MLEIFEHIRANGMIYIVVAIFAIPLAYWFRAQTIPLIYHTAEYFIYCLVFHFFVGGVMKVGWWYRSETAFKNADGSPMSGVEPFTTPLSFRFWEKELYNPQWLFYFEAAAAVAILYLVVVVRPMRYKRNVHRGRLEKPLENRRPKKGNDNSTPDLSQRKMKMRRDRLQKIRGAR